jgi:8-hydroxy-5-deazaflavin:NADPH oxidoreductase
MNIGIVGSGKVGRALGSWLATLGHSVAFSSRTQEHANDAAITVGNGASHGSIQDVIHKSEIILLTLPHKEIASALR